MIYKKHLYSNGYNILSSMLEDCKGLDMSKAMQEKGKPLFSVGQIDNDTVIVYPSRIGWNLLRKCDGNPEKLYKLLEGEVFNV